MKKESDYILILDKLDIGYGKDKLASGISVKADIGKVVALIGPNGAGKSTLLKTVTGNLKPLNGDILIYGRSLNEYSRRELARIMSIVSTEYESTAGGLKVHELVGIGRHPSTGFFGRLGAEDRCIIAESMERVGIAHKSDCFIGNLSDGERQKAMIARALAQDTHIIVLDEPFSFLDPSARIEIFMLLKRVALENNRLILLSSHDVTQALRLADELWMIGNRQFNYALSSDAAGNIDSLFKSSKVEFSTEILDFIPIN